jgi:uncharacterized protein YcgI (DUF1989 family)
VQVLRIPARQGVAVPVRRGQVVEVVNTYGQQVVDTWAFASADAAEWMSMEHSRLHMGRVNPVVGDILVTNRRRPILRLAADTSGGVHDTLLAACDRYRYELLGCAEPHDNCTDNLHAALASVGLAIATTPSPLNLFENARPTSDGTIGIAPPVATPGSCVTLRAEMDALLVFSACPQDMVPTNGADLVPTDAHLRILDSGIGPDPSM